MFHYLELEFIRFLHQFRTPFIDRFFKTLDLFDRHEFFFVLIPFIWLTMGRKLGLRLFCILFLNGLINHGLKYAFSSPRPFHLEPSLGIIQVSGWGFPSGAAQTVILLSGLLLRSWTSSWKWIIAVNYILFISFSRIFLGVHFPSDILGGWCIGFMLLAIYMYCFPKLEILFSRMRHDIIYLFIVILPWMMIFFSNDHTMVRVCSVSIGLGLSLLLNDRFQLSFQPSIHKKRYRLCIAMIGIIGTFFLYWVTSCFFPFTSKTALFLQFCPIGIWGGLGGPLMYRLFSLKKALDHNR